jgi:hypothetical protein
VTDDEIKQALLSVHPDAVRLPPGWREFAREIERRTLERVTAAAERFDAFMGHIGGCSDGGCVIVRPKGMHTNGGCRCPQDKYKMQRAMFAAIELRRALTEPK